MDRHRVRPHARRLPAAGRPDGRPVGPPPHAPDGTDPVLVRLTAGGPGGIRRAADRRAGPAGLRGGAAPTGRPVDPRRDLRRRRRAQPRAGYLRRRHRDRGVGRVIASGLLTDGPGWRWVFFINVPVGVVLIALATVFLLADRERGVGRFDVAGATT